jgi:threonyl-tRNA synthetase
MDGGDERMNAKIRNAQNQKIPYMLILGEKERQARAISVRSRNGEQKNMVPLGEFVSQLEKEAALKSLD